MTATVGTQERTRFATDADLDGVMDSHSRVFGTRSDAVYRDFWRRQVDLSDIIVALDDADTDPRIIGSAMYYRLTLQLPGERAINAAGGGMSLVEPTHRRRGIYRMMYTRLLSTARDRGLPILAGMPSQGTIYRRFGLGPASRVHTARIDRRFMTFTVPTDATRNVRAIDPAQARRALPELYAAFMRTAAGSVSRSAPWWDLYIADGQTVPPSHTERFYFVHPFGYAAYRLRLGAPSPAILVDEVCAATEDAHADLWAAVAGIDSFDTIEAEFSAGDPLALKLDDVRAITVTGIRDGLWLRILDVAAALSARTYDVDDAIVLRIIDPLNLVGGTFRLTAHGGEAHCARVEAEPNVTLTLDDLGSLYLGGFRAHQLARAGRVMFSDPEMSDRLDALFDTRERPFCNTPF